MGPVTHKRTILITGAGTGIGHDAALALAARGHRVLATTLTQAQAEALLATARATGVSLEAFKLDVTRPEDREQARALPIDVLISNAGVGESGSLAEVEVDRIRQTFEVNVFGALELVQIVLAGMIARREGTILLVSSIAGRVPVPFLMPYGMSKFALSAAGAGLRAELDELDCGVHVSLIEPGAIHTGFNQAMLARKYTWMGERSYFSSVLPRLQAREQRSFRWLEATSTRGIVACIVKASESRRPRLRYVSPAWQGAMIRLARMFGV
jgi:short-subunit dehydrogenase